VIPTNTHTTDQFLPEEHMNSQGKKGLQKEIRDYLRTHDRYAFETELYRKFRIPPVIVTSDREVLFPE